MAGVEHLASVAVGQPLPVILGLETRIGFASPVLEEIDGVGGVRGVAHVKVEVAVVVPVVETRSEAAATVGLLVENERGRGGFEVAVAEGPYDVDLAVLGSIDDIRLAVVLEVLDVDMQKRPLRILVVQEFADGKFRRIRAVLAGLVKVPDETALAADHQVGLAVLCHVGKANGGADPVEAAVGAVLKSVKLAAPDLEETILCDAVPKVLAHLDLVLADEFLVQKMLFRLLLLLFIGIQKRSGKS